MREMFCRECHCSVIEEYYYVHQYWHLNHKKVMSCPTCFAAVENDNLMNHMTWHEP